MKLIIDTSDAGKIVLNLNGKVFEEEAKNRKSQRLLPLLTEILQQEGKKIEDISDIETLPGPGSFTGLRVGVSIANALGYTLGIPVNGKHPDKDKFVEIHYS